MPISSACARIDAVSGGQPFPRAGRGGTINVIIDIDIDIDTDTAIDVQLSTDDPGGSGSPLGALLEPGRVAFNEGRFFEAHELWEDVWRERQGVERTFVQGLIQIAAGLHHARGGRPEPAGRQLAKGLEKVDRGAGAVPPGLRVDLLARQIVALARRLSRRTEPPG